MISTYGSILVLSFGIQVRVIKHEELSKQMLIISIKEGVFCRMPSRETHFVFVYGTFPLR